MAVIRVEVVDARRDGVSTAKVELPAGALVRDALQASGLNLDPSAVGIFGKRVAPDARLADGDRVEIYRPLALDPKERRRQRAGTTRKKPR
ncbi:MAG TPA: RnfH family protein [Burkholderiales bacterium]